MKAGDLQAADGGPGNDSEPLIQLEDDGKSSRPGPAAKSYERGRAAAGGHLRFNAFWLASTFAYIKCTCETHDIKLIME